MKFNSIVYITAVYFGNRTSFFERPTIDGKTALGASSPAKPALHIPDPLSKTNADVSSSHIFVDYMAGEVLKMINESMTICIQFKIKMQNCHPNNVRQFIAHSYLSS